MSHADKYIELFRKHKGTPTPRMEKHLRDAFEAGRVSMAGAMIDPAIEGLESTTAKLSTIFEALGIITDAVAGRSSVAVAAIRGPISVIFDANRQAGLETLASVKLLKGALDLVTNREGE